MSSIDFLKTAQIFKNLNEDQLKIIEHCCEEKTFFKGDMLFAEGKDADHVWCVEEGDVDLRFELPGGRPTSSNNTISTRTTQMVLGWSCLVSPYKYRLSAYCATETCKVIKVDKNCLLRLFEKDSMAGYTFMLGMVEVVGDRFHQLQESSSAIFDRTKK